MNRYTVTLTVATTAALDDVVKHFHEQMDATHEVVASDDKLHEMTVQQVGVEVER